MHILCHDLIIFPVGLNMRQTFRQSHGNVVSSGNIIFNVTKAVSKVYTNEFVLKFLKVEDGEVWVFGF